MDCYENKLAFPIHILNQKFENSMDFLLVIDEKKSHYVYIKDFDRFMFHTAKNKTRNTFVKVVCSVLVVKKYWQNINKFEKGTTEFKIYLKQLPVSLKVYADFDSNLESVESYSKSIKITFLAVLRTSLFLLMINLVS